MPYYVAPQCPEHLLPISGKDGRAARFKAATELSFLFDEGEIQVETLNGFSTRSFVKVTKEDLMSEQEEEISAAVKTLSKLSHAKRQVQELRKESIEARKKIAPLFEDAYLTDEEYGKIQVGLRVLGRYAKAVAAYKEALPSSEKSMAFLSDILQSPE